ncbi:MAG: 2-phospho-L-lactate transferase [Anaerolineaceae bacterium]|nr:2-phospho-L-lactate transferase [Anaerolineaceae bacterium]
MKFVALAGGVGGAKLVDGLYRVLPHEDLTVIVNTGDDFEHLGLRISPDLDTVCYTLAGLANPDTGWGRSDESWKAIENVTRLGGPDWFKLGDGDLGTHLERTRRLKAGDLLSRITKSFCQSWGVSVPILPMTNDIVQTHVITKEFGDLTFQEYFVKYQCSPRVVSFKFIGIESAKPAPGVLSALREADWIIFSPSNPWVSIGPILAVPGLQDCLLGKNVIAVSPIIGGKAIKGPAAKMYAELNIVPSSIAVANQYRELLTCFVIDNVDANESTQINDWGIISLTTNTLMLKIADRVRLAEEILAFCEPQRRETKR